MRAVPPFTATNLTGIVAKHLTETPPPLPTHGVILPALETVIMRALAKDANARQPDATAFARELQGAVGSSVKSSSEPTVMVQDAPQVPLPPPATQTPRQQAPVQGSGPPPPPPPPPPAPSVAGTQPASTPSHSSAE